MGFEKVNAWIDQNRDEVVTFLQAIIRIPSVSGNEGPVQDFIEGYLTGLGLAVEKFVPSLEELRRHPAYVKESGLYEGRPNVVSVCRGTGGGRSLLFNGHVDVIPEGAPENWEHGPWSADISDGKMYGRGTSDMKSGAAAFTMALRAVLACGIRLRGDVISEYVMDEELTGNGTLACVMKGYRADAGICCETSGMSVQPGSIGRIWFEIKIKGKAAGIQRRYEGVNAIELGGIVTRIVAQYEAERVKRISHPLYPDILGSIPCMIGQFESGTYYSAFPDSCLLKGSMATVPGEDSRQVKADFAAFVRRRAGEEASWMKECPPEVVYTGYFAEPSEIPASSPIVETLCANFEAVLGKKPSISGRQGAADIRHLNTFGGTPTVIFGPGLTEQMHANNEWVYVEDYISATKVLAATILDWCGVADG
jgi:acetylornithine deacetylase